MISPGVPLQARERVYFMDPKKKDSAPFLMGFAVVAAGILLCFLLLRIDDVLRALRGLFSILTPFVYGGIMAYALRGPCNFFERLLDGRLPPGAKGLSPGLAILLSLSSAFLILYFLLSMVLPQITYSVVSIVTAMPDTAERAVRWLEEALQGNPVMEKYLQTAMESVNQYIQNWTQVQLLPTLQGMLDGFASTVSSVVSLLANLLIGLVVCVYGLSARKTFARQARAVLYSVFPPRWVEQILNEICYADRMFVGFFNGKILDSAIIGVLCYLFSLLFGFPNAMLVSVIVGVTNIIPCFGPYIGAVPSALLILMEDPVKCLWFLVFIILLQQFDGNVLGPRLLAGSTGLSGFWVLFSIIVFGGLFGFAGMLVGVPIFAVIYDVGRKLVVCGLRKNGRLDVLQGGGEQRGQNG